MAIHVDSRREAEPQLSPEFDHRLEQSLHIADAERKRFLLAERARMLLPVGLLVGPIIGWRLMSVGPSGIHIVIDALAWLTFLLDIGVHIDTELLGSVGLQALPTVIGVLLFLLVTATLLTHEGTGS